jgi:hypothetical protein
MCGLMENGTVSDDLAALRGWRAAGSARESREVRGRFLLFEQSHRGGAVKSSPVGGRIPGGDEYWIPAGGGDPFSHRGKADPRQSRTPRLGRGSNTRMGQKCRDGIAWDAALAEAEKTFTPKAPRMPIYQPSLTSVSSCLSGDKSDGTGIRLGTGHEAVCVGADG